MTAHYVYRCYDADGRLLYVGQSKDWTVRLATHRYRAFWAADVVQVRVAVHPSPDAARAAERTAIRNENPRFNYQGRWETRAQWSREDWVDYVQTIVVGGNAPGSYVNRTRLDLVLRSYAAKFNEPHPAEARLREEFAVIDAKRAEERERERIKSRIDRERLDLADRLSELDHCEKCPPCARAGKYADDCPEMVAFDIEEQARIDAERARVSS